MAETKTKMTLEEAKAMREEANEVIRAEKQKNSLTGKYGIWRAFRKIGTGYIRDTTIKPEVRTEHLFADIAAFLEERGQ